MHAFKSNALISLKRHSVIMLIADDLPGDTLGVGIAGTPLLGISVQVLAFCTLWHYLGFIAFHRPYSFSFSPDSTHIARPHRFRGIYADEPDLFTIAQNDCIAVNDLGAYEAIGLGTGKGY